MLKRKYSNKPDYKHTAKFHAKTEYMNQSDFNGYVTLFRFDEVQKPLLVTFKNEEYCLVDIGYIWLQLLPANEKYCLTTLIDNRLNIIEWYFDIIKEQGVIDQVPYFDDIYLDIVLPKNDTAYLLDEDELQEALDKKIITPEDYQEAYEIANDILKNKVDREHLTKLTYKYLNYMLDRIE